MLLTRGCVLACMAMLLAYAPLAAPVAAWDNTYGERSDEQSFSSVRAAAEASDGGLYLLGWFWGEFEGLSRPGQYGTFLMKVGADGKREFVWEFDYDESYRPESIGAPFSLAVAPQGDLWFTPGPSGGLVRAVDGAVVQELSDYHYIAAATSHLMLVGTDPGADYTSEPFHALDYAGAHQWTWSLREQLISQGVETTMLQGPYVVADDEGIYVTGVWRSTHPYADDDSGAWAISPEGDTLWATAMVGQGEDHVCPLATVLTPQRVVAPNCSYDPERREQIWEFDRADGHATVTQPPAAVLCGDRDPTVLFAGDSSTEACPAGTRQVTSCGLGGFPPPHSRFSSPSTERIYRECDDGAVLRWHRSDDEWMAEVAATPFGHHAEETNEIWGGFEASDGALVLYGNAGRTANFTTSESDVNVAASNLYSAAATKGALDDVPEPGGVHRLAGRSRFDTAGAIATSRFDAGAVSTVYLATGANFPDALAGGPLAAQRGGPILLASSETLPGETAEILGVLGPTEVVALGGAAAISDEVVEAAKLAAGAATASRISGPDRYATAAAIAAQLGPAERVFLATGSNFPDALAGGAATNGAPILLTHPTYLPAATREALAALDPQELVALGGQSAVSDGVLAEAAEAAGHATTGRLAGRNRYETALEIASSMASPGTVYVATAGNFPDALAGVSAAAAEGAPVVLTHPDELPAAVEAWLREAPSLRRVVVLGGSSAVSNEVADRLGSVLLD